MMIIILISGIVLINNPIRKTINITPKVLAKNYEIEFLNLTTNNPTAEDLNNLNKRFEKFVNSNNYDTGICSIVETEDYILLSNFTGVDCQMIIDGNENQLINDNTTVTIDRFINNMNIYLCSCYYISGENIYYIDIHNEDSKTILKN
jgi:hypothetical protein